MLKIPNIKMSKDPQNRDANVESVTGNQQEAYRDMSVAEYHIEDWRCKKSTKSRWQSLSV